MQDAMRSHARTASMASNPCPWCVWTESGRKGCPERRCGHLWCAALEHEAKPRRRRAAAYATWRARCCWLASTCPPPQAAGSCDQIRHLITSACLNVYIVYN